MGCETLHGTPDLVSSVGDGWGKGAEGSHPDLRGLRNPTTKCNTETSFFDLSKLTVFREGNDTPLQCSCLENPMDGGAWWAAVHGVAKSRAQLSDFTFTHWRRKWQPTPVLLPGESQGRGSLVGCRLWGRTESDTTEAI